MGVDRALGLLEGDTVDGIEELRASEHATGARAIAAMSVNSVAVSSTGSPSRVRRMRGRSLVCAASHLRDTIGLVLIGHSLGGAAVLAAAHRVPEVRGVVTIGAPADTAHVEHLLGSSKTEIETQGIAEVLLAGRPFRISTGFLTDIKQQNQAACIAGLGRALLVLHSPQSDLVGIDNARLVFDAARHPRKSFVSLDGADHLLTDRGDATYVAEVLAAWASRYLTR